MKYTTLFALSFLLMNCRSSLQKIIESDRDCYSVLNKQEFMVVQTPYTVLKEQPSLGSVTLNLLRKNTIIRILWIKQVTLPHQLKPEQWFYVENITDSSEKGWITNGESLIAPSLYNARYLSTRSAY